VRVLILGGTQEARELAAALLARGDQPVTSLAGAVSNPRRPPGQTVIGALAAPHELARLVTETGADAVVDATHPFAAAISALAAHAPVPVIRLHRPGWRQTAGDRWRRVPDIRAAAAAVEPGRRVLLTTGRRGLDAVAPVTRAWFLIRAITRPEPPLPPHHEVLLDRGPYTLAGERALLARHAIDLIVTKDSGGPATEAKLRAARERGIPVVVVDRPAPPPGVPTVATVPEALARLGAPRILRPHAGGCPPPRCP
jgi:precorrin-6A/cobalt-precorrin-6A reductase